MQIKVTESPDYVKDIKKVKDKSTKEQLYKHLQKITQNPAKKKFLRNILSGKQKERIGKFRLIYGWSSNFETLNLLRFRKRGSAYK